MKAGATSTWKNQHLSHRQRQRISSRQKHEQKGGRPSPPGRPAPMPTTTPVTLCAACAHGQEKSFCQCCPLFAGSRPDGTQLVLK